MIEHALRPLELRAEGRRLQGIALKYGDVSPSHRERFEPGAFDLSGGPTRWLDYRHDRTRVLAHTAGGGLTLRDSDDALFIDADLPELPLTDRALAEIASGALSGLSIEFHAMEESRDGEIRVVEKADLAGIGLVASPSYPASGVEIRQSGTITSTIPYDSNLACECYGRGQSGEQGKGMTATIRLEPGSLILPDSLIAVWKNFGAPLASTDKGTLRVSEGRKGLGIEMDLPDTTWGEDILGASEGVPIVIRPMFDASEVEVSESFKAGYEGADKAIANLRKVPVRALLVGPTPNGEGWPEAKITPSQKRREAASRRERFAWL